MDAEGPADAFHVYCDEGRRAGARLFLHRRITGQRPEILARMLGVSRAALYRYEKGEIIKLETIHKIARLVDKSFVATTAPLSVAEVCAEMALKHQIDTVEILRLAAQIRVAGSPGSPHT